MYYLALGCEQPTAKWLEVRLTTPMQEDNIETQPTSQCDWQQLKQKKILSVVTGDCADFTAQVGHCRHAERSQCLKCYGLKNVRPGEVSIFVCFAGWCQLGGCTRLGGCGADVRVCRSGDHSDVPHNGLLRCQGIRVSPSGRPPSLWQRPIGFSWSAPRLRQTPLKRRRWQHGVCRAHAYTQTKRKQRCRNDKCVAHRGQVPGAEQSPHELPRPPDIGHKRQKLAVTNI